MTKEEFINQDFLRPLNQVMEPDPVTSGFGKFENGEIVPIKLSDYHEAISNIMLHEGVPEHIRIHFGTAKNLYLYAWFIYRFYPVSEKHALASLEFAMRERFADEMKAIWKEKERIRKEKEGSGYRKKRYLQPNLSRFLQYAVREGFIKDEGYSEWRRITQMRSRIRYGMEQPLGKGFNEEDAQVTEEDKNWSYVERLPNILPKIRNNYAHGSDTLHNFALGTIRDVAETINQIYPSSKGRKHQSK